jgi:tetratricopeptide (TPR) repeat protein
MKSSVRILVFLFCISITYSQNTLDQMKNLVKDKEYEKAILLIPQAAAENKKNSSAFELFGDIYYEMEKIDSAILMYQRSYELEKDNKLIMRKYAKTLAENKNITEALKMIELAIKEDKNDVYNYIQKGLIYVQVDSFQLARTFLTKAREMDKTIPDAFVALGDLYYAWKIYDPAISHYEEALALDEKLIDARIKLANSYYWRANSESDSKLRDEYFNRSLKEWNRVGKDDPKNARAFFQQGKIFYLASRWGSAAQAFFKYTDLRPDGHLGRWYLAQCLVKIDSCEAAIPQLEIVMSNIDSVKTKARLELARCNAKLKKYEPSVKYFDAIIADKEILENNDLFLYANSVWNLKDTTKAIDLFKSYFDKESTKTTYMAWFASQMFKRKSYEDAIVYFQKVIDNLKNDKSVNGNNGSNPETNGNGEEASNGEDKNKEIPKMYYYIGLSQQSMTRYKEAADAFKNCISFDSTYLKAYVNLADAYAAMEMMPESIDNFRKAIDKGSLDTAQNMPTVRLAFQKLAGVYFKDKKYDDLKNISDKWTKLEEKNSMAWFYMGLSYHGKGDKENACRYYKKSLSLDKDNASTKKALSQLKCDEM